MGKPAEDQSLSEPFIFAPGSLSDCCLTAELGGGVGGINMFFLQSSFKESALEPARQGVFALFLLSNIGRLTILNCLHSVK